MTALLGVVGDPISQSLSPLIHNGWHRDHGIDAKYMAFQVADGAFDDALGTLTRQGVRGFNITAPHKLAAFQAADLRTEACEMIGAANTMTMMPDGQWRAHNTDLGGFRSALVDWMGDPSGRTALVLGAGGASRAVCVGLLQLGVRISIANRTRERALELATLLSLPASEVVSLDALDDPGRGDDLVVNCLSLGHVGGELALPEGQGRHFYDISYGKAADPTLKHAEDRGWQTLDGLSMLVGQAAEAFELWHGQVPDRALAMQRCRTALEAVS